ncbi:unnamed protein product [Onchocerca flexuosa]|uniref:Transposase n=1 Tax=Onchocerca flexuosa TaxID=387005 RepID=A0A183HH29_9BILA|nr:unnamed protein product [Onchocerca flexuosa]
MKEFKATVNQESENNAIKNNAKPDRTNRTNLLVMLFFTLIITDVIYIRESRNNG